MGISDWLNAYDWSAIGRRESEEWDEGGGLSRAQVSLKGLAMESPENCVTVRKLQVGWFIFHDIMGVSLTNKLLDIMGVSLTNKLLLGLVNKANVHSICNYNT